MTAAVLRSSPNLAVPQTQNTAPVHEFNCLYTHDLRRKQKRWQDGFLRYHTFNKRVMVYDVPRNFLGDLHWTSGDDLQEGDEMTLEKGGIMVQVSERVGTIQTDLSDLLQRKDKTPAKNPASSRTLPRHGPPYAAASSIIPRTPHAVSTTPMKHKSLNALLGRSRRPIGKASLPTESPYEARIRDLQAAEAQDQRERKRQRLDSPAQTTPMAAKRRSNEPLAGQQANPVPRPQPGCEVIDLSSDTEDISAAQAASRAIDAELLATSSPARLLESSAPRQTAFNQFRPIDKQPTAAMPAIVDSPSVRVSNRSKHADFPPVSNTARPRKETSVSREAPKKSAKVAANEPLRAGSAAAESDSQTRGKSLKLVGGAPRKMLVFQSQNSRPSSSETVTDGALRGKAQDPRQENSLAPLEKSVGMDINLTAKQPAVEQDPEDSVFQRRIQERLARIEKKKQKPVLQRSSSDVTEQRPVVEKATNNTTGLRKTTSAVMSRLDSPEDPSLADFQFADITPLDFDDPIVDDSVAHPPTRPSRELVEKTASRKEPVERRPTARGTSTTTARSFKPLTVKTAPVLSTRTAQILATEQKKNEDIGPWSKEAFDLMDWRPPNLQADTNKT